MCEQIQFIWSGFERKEKDQAGEMDEALGGEGMDQTVEESCPKPGPFKHLNTNQIQHSLGTRICRGTLSLGRIKPK